MIKSTNINDYDNYYNLVDDSGIVLGSIVELGAITVMTGMDFVVIADKNTCVFIPHNPHYELYNFAEIIAIAFNEYDNYILLDNSVDKGIMLLSNYEIICVNYNKTFTIKIDNGILSLDD